MYNGDYKTSDGDGRRVWLRHEAEGKEITYLLIVKLYEPDFITKSYCIKSQESSLSRTVLGEIQLFLVSLVHESFLHSSASVTVFPCMRVTCFVV